MRQLLTTIVAVSLLLGFGGTAAAVVVPPILDYQASLDDGLNDIWENLNGIGTHNWTLNGAPWIPAGTNVFNITNTYQFDGATVAQTLDFEKIDGINYDKGPATFEFLFKPVDLDVGDKEIIFESGGVTDGSALYIQDGVLKWVSKDNSNRVRASFDLTPIGTSDFIHVVSVADIAANTAQLYVNGAAGTVGGGGDPNDWCGGNDSGLAGEWNATPESGTSFEGQISLLRFYNSLLVQADVDELYTILTTIPEPTLTWDALGDAEWADLTGGGGTDSHWLGGDLDSVPGSLTPTVVETSTVWIDGPREALTLTINSGTVNVRSGGVLDVYDSLLPSAGTLAIDDGGEVSVAATVEMSADSTAQIDGVLGALGNVTLAGTVNVGAIGELEGANVNLPVGSIAQIDGLMASAGTIDLAGTATVGVDGSVDGGTVNLASGSTVTLNGSVETGTLNIDATPTVGVGASISALTAMNVNTDLNASGATLATDTAAVTVPGGVTLTYDQALAVGGLDLEGTVDLSTALLDKTVTVTGGTLRLASVGTLTGVDTIALDSGTLNISRIVAPGVAPAAAPLAHWAFDETFGVEAPDSSGNDRVGSLAGFPTEDDSQWVDGVIGGALAFDGIDDQVNITGYKGVLGSAPRTITAWIKTDHTDTTLINWGNNSSGEKWTFRVEGSGRLRVEVSDGSSVATTDLRDDEWHHVAVVFPEDLDPTTGDLLFYVDGQLENRASLGDLPIGTTAGVDVRIGHDFNAAGRRFDGTMDDLRLYGEALSAADVAAMFGGEVPRDMSSTSLSISGVSTVNAASAGETIFAGAELLDGSSLTLSGPGSYNLTSLTLPTGPATATLDALVTTVPGPITANGGTLIKTGAGELILDADGSGLAGATLDLQGGRTVSVQGATSPLGTAAVRIGDAELLLAASGATAVYDNAITATGIGTLTVGAGDAAGAVPGVAVTLGGTNGLTLDPASMLTLKTTDGYTLDLAGSIAGTGELIVPGAVTLNVTGAASTIAVGGLDLAGSLVLDAATTDKTVTVQGGTMTLRNIATLTGVDNIALSAGTLSVRQKPVAGIIPGAPAAAWTFDETAGLTAGNAITPGTNDGALIDYVDDDSQWVAGIRGGALHFDGTNDFVDAGTTDLTAAYTVAMWVKTDGMVQNSQYNSPFVSAGNEASGNGFQIDVGAEIGGNYRWRGGPNVNMGPASDDWIHLAVTFDGTTVNTYYDGQLANTSVTDGMTFDQFLFGRNRANDWKYEGTIDDAYVYNTALSAEDIAAMFGTPTAPDTAGLNLQVDGPSALQSNYAGETALPSLTLADASTLTLSSPGTFAFGTTTILSGTATIDMPMATTLGPIAANGGTLVKTGAGELILDADSSGLTGATLAVNGGQMVSVQGATSPLNNAAVQIGNGELLLAAADPGGSIAYDNAVTATGNGTLTAGHGGVAGAAVAAVVTLGGATNGLTVDAGATLSVETDSGYTLDVAGNTVVSGTLALNSENITGMTNVSLTGGTLDLKGAVFTPSPAVAADPAVHWKFDEGAGPIAFNDVNALTQSGTLLPSTPPATPPQWIAGIDGSALQFDDVDDFVQITGYKGISGSASRTMSAWIKVPPEATNEAIVSWGTLNPAGTKWNFRVQDTDGQAGAIRVEVNGGYRVGMTDVRDDQWHHVVAVLPEGVTNVNGMLLYVDGQYDGQSAVSGQAINTDTALGEDVRIGVDHADNFFNGGIDDVVLYDRGLSPTEVAAMFGTIEVTDTSAMNLTVNGDSTINSSATGNTGFASLMIEDGTLATAGPGTFSFGSTTIAAGAMATGFSSDAAVDLGPVVGNGTTATVTKTGAGNLALSGTITGLQDASVDVQGGGLSMADNMAVSNLRTATDATVNTGGNAVTISDTFALGDVDLGISGATMTVSGSNLAVATNLTAGGGTLTITPKYATKVLVVSDSNDPDVAGGEHNDDALVPLLKEMGYQVDTIGMGGAFQEGQAPFSDQNKLDSIDAADVVLVTRRTNSGAYDDDRQSWNAIAKPLLLTSGYLTRGTDKWGWTTAGSGNVADRTLTDMVVEAGQEGHEFLDGLDEPMSMFDWSTAPNAEAPKQVYLPNANTARPGTTLIGTYEAVNRPFLIDIPAGFDLDEGAAAYFGTTGERRVFMGHWGYDGNDPDGNPYQFDSFATDKFHTLFGNVLGALAPLEYAPQTDLAAVNLTVTADTVITAPVDTVVLGNLSVQPGVTSVTLSDADFAVADATIADGVTVNGNGTLQVGGTLNVGGGIDGMTVNNAGLVFGPNATYNAKVSLGGAEGAADSDKIVITGTSDIHLDGTLAPKGVGRTSSGFFSPSTTVTVIDNAGFLDGVVHGADPNLFEFAAVDPAPAADKTAHIGQGAFLRAVNYVKPDEFPTITDAVELDLFIALGGDSDGDGKVWLSDWAALRAKFGN
ncbi:MAG: hypothetical protein HQ567_05050, partial [Candidatus Nealsonbacteria bacterium]|nr:hypothetical protein [Candidatus Nealsonbacteria bacterium]